MSKDAFTITDHKLNGVPFEEANAWRNQVMAPTLVVVHDTAGALRPRSSVEWFLSPECSTSAHLVVERDGSVTQLVPFDRIAFHAGQSTWQGRANCNAFSIGIEIVNPGKLTKVGTAAKASFGAAWPLSEVKPRSTREHGAGYWMPYTPAQIETVTAICKRARRGLPDRGHHHALGDLARPQDRHQPAVPAGRGQGRRIRDRGARRRAADRSRRAHRRQGWRGHGGRSCRGRLAVGWLADLDPAVLRAGRAHHWELHARRLHGGLQGHHHGVKEIAVNNSSALLFLGVVAGAAIAIAVFMARQRIVDAAREGRYQPQQK